MSLDIHSFEGILFKSLVWFCLCIIPRTLSKNEEPSFSSSLSSFCIINVFFFFCLLEVCNAETGSGAGGEEDPRGWWFSDTQASSFNALQQCDESFGLEESVSAVKEAVKAHGPFDGILGFSQGAAFVAMLCCLQEQKPEPDFTFRFAVLVAGFRSLCKEHEKFYSTTLQIPSLHVFGLEDRVIPDHMSWDLLPSFQDPQVLIHPGGHFVPAASAHRQTYQDFLKKFQ